MVWSYISWKYQRNTGRFGNSSHKCNNKTSRPIFRSEISMFKYSRQCSLLPRLQVWVSLLPYFFKTEFYLDCATQSSWRSSSRHNAPLLVRSNFLRFSPTPTPVSKSSLKTSTTTQGNSGHILIIMGAHWEHPDQTLGTILSTLPALSPTIHFYRQSTTSIY